MKLGCCCVRLTSFLQKLMPLYAGRELGRSGADIVRESPQSVVKRFGLFETTPLLHGAAPCLSWAGAL
jgi:hypothetical protein